MLDLLFLLALVIIGTPVFALVVFGIIYGGAWTEWLLECLLAWVGRESLPPKPPLRFDETDISG